MTLKMITKGKLISIDYFYIRIAFYYAFFDCEKSPNGQRYYFKCLCFKNFFITPSRQWRQIQLQLCEKHEKYNFMKVFIATIFS